MSHGASRRVHCLLTNLWIDDSHSNDSPQESLVWIGRLLTPESLQFFMIEEGLDPKIVVHPKSLELLSQREVGKDHIEDLGRANQSSIKRRPDLLRLPVVLTGSLLQTFEEKA